MAATTGVLNTLSERELRGVVAHRLAHVQHRDTLISTASATMAGAISALANFAVFFGGRNSKERPANPVAGIVVATPAPLAASLIQMAISRAHELEANRGDATISGSPQALASALGKVRRHAADIPFTTAEAHPATTQMMIVNPLYGDDLADLFSTHPATEGYIAHLIQTARTGQYPA